MELYTKYYNYYEPLQKIKDKNDVMIANISRIPPLLLSSSFSENDSLLSFQISSIHLFSLSISLSKCPSLFLIFSVSPFLSLFPFLSFSMIFPFSLSISLSSSHYLSNKHSLSLYSSTLTLSPNHQNGTL